MNRVSRLVCGLLAGGLAIVSCAVFAHAGSMTAPEIQIYRVRHRPAAELVAIAENAMGSGTVTLDSRTATLVLNGSPEAIDRAMRVLEAFDQRLRQLVLRQTTRRLTEEEAVGVSWSASIGPVRLGALSGSRLSVSAGGSRRGVTSSSVSVLRLLEGATGVIATGRSLPVLFEPYWGVVGYAGVETGFEVTAHVQGEPAAPTIQLELRPFAGRVEENGELQYISAATSIVVEPGETVVVGETSVQTESSHRTTSELARESEIAQDVLLIEVVVER